MLATALTSLTVQRLKRAIKLECFCFSALTTGFIKFYLHYPLKYESLEIMPNQNISIQPTETQLCSTKTKHKLDFYKKM